MADEHKIKSFTAADIEKYHKGLLSPKERHAMEKASLDDPFLADALEGYDNANVNVPEDIAELKKRLSERTEDKTTPALPRMAPSVSWWKVAAMTIMVAGAGLLVYQISFNKKSNDIAQFNKSESDKTETKDQANSKPDSQNGLITDTNSTAASQQKENLPKLKITEQSKKVPVSTEAAGNTAAEPESLKDNVVKNIQTPATPATATAKTDDNAAETKRSLRNDNAFDKAEIAEKTEDLKAKEFTVRKKADTDGDGVKDVLNKKGAVNPGYAANTKKESQGFLNQTNIFRGRVTDASNNALPFSNITNLEDNIGTYADARGYFTLTSPDSVLNVQVRSLGFETNTVQLINSKPENKILLEEDKSLNAKVLDTVRRNINRSRHSAMTLDEPEPVDGWTNYDTYLVNNLKVPESFRTRQADGEVELSFEVDKNGEPVNIKVKKSLCESCDKEAIRLIKEGPKWKRKVKKGKATVTITF